MSRRQTTKNTPAGETATLMVVRKIKPEHEKEFWAMEERAAAEAAKYPGFVALNHIPTSSEKDLEYFSILHFDSVEHLVAWEKSPDRARHLRDFRPFIEGDMRPRRVTGLEGLFATGAQAVRPPRYKMVLVLIPLIFSMLAVIQPLVAFVFNELALTELNSVIRMLIVVCIQVPLMTYVAMPIVNKVLAKWLLKS